MRWRAGLGKGSTQKGIIEGGWHHRCKGLVQVRTLPHVKSSLWGSLQKILLPSPPCLPMVRMALVWFCLPVYTIVCYSFLWDHTRCSPQEISDWFIVFNLCSPYSVDSHYVLFFLLLNVPRLFYSYIWFITLIVESLRHRSMTNINFLSVLRICITLASVHILSLRFSSCKMQ